MRIWKVTGIAIVVVFLAVALVACKSTDQLGQKIAKVGTTFLQAVAANYTGQYASVVNALVQTISGEEPPADYGYGGYGGYEQVAQNEGYYDQSQGQQTYPQSQGGGYYDQAQGQGAYGQAQGGYTEPQQQGSYYDQQIMPLALDVAILKKTPGNNVEPIQDGAVLVDGRGDPARGDQFKITFRANTSCYVYVVAADATGYVEPVFPHSDDAYTNPVAPGVQYEMPRSATSSWYGLDDYRGIETIFFVASRQPRPNLERILNDLISQKEKRRPVDQIVPVTEPIVVASAPITQGLPSNCTNRGIVRVSDCMNTRGIVRIESQQAATFEDLNAGGAMTVTTGGGRAYDFAPETFMTAAGDDLTFTRWFRHE